MALKIPILFLIFNRPNLTEKVFRQIQIIKPSRLYIASDGPRKNKKREGALVEQSREIALNHIDWACDIKTLFRGKNLGCQKAVSEAITWFFDHEEEGIILEDDCLPNQSFFRFCEEILERYRDDKTIMHISGNNFQNDIKRGAADYYFSIYNHLWGWATWKRSWEHFKLTIEKPHIVKNFINNNVTDKKSIKFWMNILKQAENNNIRDSWGYFWTLSIWQQNGISILPNQNLVVNIGFNEDATHTNKTSSFIPTKARDLNSPLTHPQKISISKEADHYTEKVIFQKRSLIQRMYNKFKETFKI